MWLVSAEERNAGHAVQEGVHLQQREEEHEHHRPSRLRRLPRLHQGSLRDHHEEVQLHCRRGEYLSLRILLITKIFLVLYELVHECIMGTGTDNTRGRVRLAPSRVYYQCRFP